MIHTVLKEFYNRSYEYPVQLTALVDEGYGTYPRGGLYCQRYRCVYVLGSKFCGWAGFQERETVFIISVSATRRFVDLVDKR
jgi:hypothetical protein